MEQAEAEVPKSGYDTSRYYVVPADETGKPLEPTGFTADVSTISVDSDIIKTDSTRISPENANAYSGYLIGDGLAPNGENVTMGTSFPTDSIEGDYVLRLDFLPNRLFRYNGSRWVKVEDSVRSPLTPGKGIRQLDTFTNNTDKTTRDDNVEIDQRVGLSQILSAREDD